jgi:mono/diheme cytochrome c family protein
MKNSSYLVTAFVSLTAVAGSVLWFSSKDATAADTKRSAPDVAPLTGEARIARGKHLVMTSGCHDCHTPLKQGANGPEWDLSRALSGHPESLEMPPAPAPNGPWAYTAAVTNTAWSGPWGVSFTANLTPDKETGLGTWTEDNFVQTIKTGRHLGRGRPVLPPMPIPAYSNFSEEDLGAIFAYLQSLPAIKNRVPTPRPPASGEAHRG